MVEGSARGREGKWGHADLAYGKGHLAHNASSMKGMMAVSIAQSPFPPLQRPLLFLPCPLPPLRRPLPLCTAPAIITVHAHLFSLSTAHGHAHADLAHGEGHLAHKHDDRVSSVGLIMEGSCDMNKLNEWLSKLVQVRGCGR